MRCGRAGGPGCVAWGLAGQLWEPSLTGHGAWPGMARRSQAQSCRPCKGRFDKSGRIKPRAESGCEAQGSLVALLDATGWLATATVLTPGIHRGGTAPKQGLSCCLPLVVQEHVSPKKGVDLCSGPHSSKTNQDSESPVQTILFPLHRPCHHSPQGRCSLTEMNQVLLPVLLACSSLASLSFNFLFAAQLPIAPTAMLRCGDYWETPAHPSPQTSTCHSSTKPTTCHRSWLPTPMMTLDTAHSTWYCLL